MADKNTHTLSSVFIETYGCQMNMSDSELITGLLIDSGFQLTRKLDDADVVLVNTCSVREHAEQRVLGRIQTLAEWKRQYPHRKLGVLGCMAKRLGSELLNIKNPVDFVIGPDAYRTIPALLQQTLKDVVQTDSKKSETYEGIAPYRQSSISGLVTIIRGCNNFCAYCIVPYTRGRERSRSVQDILNEIEIMGKNGFREITLLGQNVNSFNHHGTDFPNLLKEIVQIPEILRIRFMTSHPKDISDKLIQVISEEDKLCSHIHLPIQAGSNHVLKMMNRKYTKEHYIDRIDSIRRAIPDVALSTDVMVGFPGETESDFQETMELMRTIRYEEAFTYYYSPRSGTKAASMDEQVPDNIKKEWLQQLIDLQRSITLEKKKQLIGRTLTVLPETESKQSQDEWMGKTDTNHIVVFPKEDIKPGELINIKIKFCKGITLWGTPTKKTNTENIECCGRDTCKL